MTMSAPHLCVLLLCALVGCAHAGVVTPCGHATIDLINDATATGGTVEAAVGACKYGGAGDCLSAVGEAWAALATLNDDAINACGVCGIWGKGPCYANVKTTADTVASAATLMDDAFFACNSTAPGFDEVTCAKAVLDASVDLVSSALFGYNAVHICTGGDQHTCLSDVLLLISNVKDTSRTVVAAANSCKIGSNHTLCAAAVRTAVEKLAATVGVGAGTAERCGLISKNPCVNDVTDAMARLGRVGGQLNTTAVHCVHGGLLSFACARDLVTVGANALSIGIDVVKAATDCRKINDTALVFGA